MYQPAALIPDRVRKGKAPAKRQLTNREALLRRLWADHNPDGSLRHEGR